MVRAASRPGLCLLTVALAWAIAPASAQSPFSFLEWRSIGPVNTSGRVDDIAVARARGAPDAIYVATASGGLFKSSNNGVSWQPVFDGVDAMMSIGAVAVAPSSPQTVWVGTGEANTRQSSSWGDGVYRSTDGGKTWTNVGLKDTRQIGRIVIDPDGPATLSSSPRRDISGDLTRTAACSRPPTRDAPGRRYCSWTKTPARTTSSSIRVTRPRCTPVRTSTCGAPGATMAADREAAIYKSTDGGETWTKLTNGLPPGDKGRIGLSIYMNDPRVVYATIETGASSGSGPGIYRTLDAGATWEKTSGLNSRPNYYSEIRIDPRDRDRIYTLGSNRGFYFSNDGGKTFTELFSNVHGEDHALWVDPDNTNHLIVGGDGGFRSHGTAVSRGISAATCRSASSTKSMSITRCHSLSAAACRTTACGVCRARCGTRTASRTGMPGTSAVVTASTRTSIRPTRRWSSSHRRTGTWRG